MPQLQDLLDRLHVVALPMRVRFRGITTREVALIDGPAGWGEFGAFPEYGPAEAAAWLASGIEGAYHPLPPVRRHRVPINATVPASSTQEQEMHEQPAEEGVADQPARDLRFAGAAHRKRERPPVVRPRRGVVEGDQPGLDGLLRFLVLPVGEGDGGGRRHG